MAYKIVMRSHFAEAVRDGDGWAFVFKRLDTGATVVRVPAAEAAETMNRLERMVF